MKDTNYSNNSSSNASTSNNSNNMSFIDETKHVSMKVKVKKRNTDLNIKQSRLRKPLQNQNLLKNYFEFNKKELVTSDLTIYKIVETNNINTNDISGTQMDTNSNIDENSENESNNRIGRKTSSDKIVTTEKIKYNPQPSNSNNLMTTSTSSSNVMNELHNSRVNIINNMNLNNNNLIFNPEDYNQFFNDNLNSNLNTNSNIDSSSPTNSSNEEFDDSQSFLSSFSFLFK